MVLVRRAIIVWRAIQFHLLPLKCTAKTWLRSNCVTASLIAVRKYLVGVCGEAKDSAALVKVSAAVFIIGNSVRFEILIDLPIVKRPIVCIEEIDVVSCPDNIGEV